MTIWRQAGAPGPGERPRARRGLRRVVSVGALTAVLGVAGTATTGAAADSPAFDVFQGATEAAPVRVGAGIPLEVFVKVGGSEAQVLQGPVARGAAMLVDTRITQLASLLIFGTVPAPPVVLPSPTVAETIWTSGSPSPQTADASAVPTGSGEPGQASTSGPVGVGAGRATAEAAEGPRGAGHAAYTDLALSPAGVKNAMRARETASDSAAAVTAEAVESSSLSVSKGISLLDGMVTIEGFRSTARAVTTGRPGGAVADGSFEMGRVAVLGKTAEITLDGIRIVDTSLPVPLRDAVNQQLQEKLAAAGATIKLLPPQRTVKDDGSFASVQSAGIAVKMAASAAQPVNPVVGDLSFNMTLGFATAEASASRSADFESPAPVTVDDAGEGAAATAVSDPRPVATPAALPGGEGAVSSGLENVAFDSAAGPFAGPQDGTGFSDDGEVWFETNPEALASGSGSSLSANSALAATASRRAPTTSNWWALGFAVLLAGFAALAGLQALPRLVRPRRWQ